MALGVHLPKNLGEFRDPKYWDAFFKARGGRPFEWYGEWNLISKLVTEQCGLKKDSADKILIPGCGNSTLSKDMYDAGFVHITNIDFSRVVISEMLRKHVRPRPLMRWLVMDMTKMQLADGSFDLVVDKGGLDALLGEPEDEASSGISFLSEVKRVLKPNGRFVCVTLAQQHVIELLLSTFREGWLVSVHGLQLSTADGSSNLQPFIVIAKHESRPNLPQVSFDLDLCWRGASNQFQMQAVVGAVDAENAWRNGLTDSRSTKGLETNPEDSYEDLHPGRRLTTKLGGHRSHFTYSVVILDAKDDIKTEYRCAVFLVPKGRANEWLFSSIEGQWQVADGTKAGRLIMVILEPNQFVDNILDLKDDLSPLVEYLLPLDCRHTGTVPFMTQGDGVASRNILAEVHSPMTGAMLVEDVVCPNGDSDSKIPSGEKRSCFRRLVFRRNPNLIQSEALLIRQKVAAKVEEKGRSLSKHAASKKKKRAAKEVTPNAKPEAVGELEVDHSYLASPYHEGMIAAFVLIQNNLQRWLDSKQQIKLMIVGLGAGLLPMFVHNHLPIDDIQIVELDPVVGDVAKLHFGFIEDDRMKLQIGDGIVAVQAIADTALQDNSNCTKQITSQSDDGASSNQSGNVEKLPTTKSENGKRVPCRTVQEGSTKLVCELEENLNMLDVRDGDNETSSRTDCRLHVLIVDADSEDPSSGLSCPPPEFLEDSFLLAARGALLDGGLLIINVVSRASMHHVQSVSQLKKYFQEVYDIEVSEDVNRVLIALPQPRNGGEPSDIMEDVSRLEKIFVQFAPWGNGPNLKEIISNMKRLK